MGFHGCGVLVASLSDILLHKQKAGVLLTASCKLPVQSEGQVWQLEGRECRASELPSGTSQTARAALLGYTCMCVKKTGTSLARVDTPCCVWDLKETIVSVCKSPHVRGQVFEDGEHFHPPRA